MLRKGKILKNVGKKSAKLENILKKVGAGGYIGFPYIDLLASDQGCQKQNTYIVSQN